MAVPIRALGGIALVNLDAVPVLIADGGLVDVGSIFPRRDIGLAEAGRELSIKQMQVKLNYMKKYELYMFLLPWIHVSISNVLLFNYVIP